MSTDELMAVVEAVYKQVKMECDTPEERGAVLTMVNVLLNYDSALGQPNPSSAPVS